MNITSDDVRLRLRELDSWLKRVSQNAKLKDRKYHIAEYDDLWMRVPMARLSMAAELGVEIQELPYIHTGANGRFDCDNYAHFGCTVLKAQWDSYCRRNVAFKDEEEYAIWPMSRKDIPHTQAIAVAKDALYVVEFITGKIVKITESNKPSVILIG